MSSKLRGGGLLLASIRDYDNILEDMQRSTTPMVFNDPSGKRILFQVWDRATDGRTYTANQFILSQTDRVCNVKHFAVKYRAVLREELSGILWSAGFSGVEWQMPEESGYFQPVVTARKSYRSGKPPLS